MRKFRPSNYSDLQLFVDDERNPADVVPDWGRYGDRHVVNSTEAIEWLTEWFDLYNADESPTIAIWLDHDLGGDDTIMPVVDWLAYASFDGILDPTKVVVVIHTQNPVGRDAMKSTLTRWGFHPIDIHL